MNSSPLEYARASILAKETGEEMLSRLDWMAIKPTIILDVGCGTGNMSAELKRRYKDAFVLALDQSLQMVQHAKQQELPSVCAEANRLPLANETVDLIFAHFILPWCSDFRLLLREWQRVLKPNGLLMLTALGLDTLKEGQGIFNTNDMPQLIDMHDVGDLLLQEKFTDPVLDVDHYTFVYREQDKLISELFHSEMLATLPDPHVLNAMPASLDGTWSITYEVIYAHAFLPALKAELSAHEEGMVRIPLTHLRRQLKSE